KFGVALRDAGAREWVVRAYLDRPWLTRLHAHTGSQGVAPSLMARGVAEAYALAEEINRRAGRRQVDTLDIGGGLPVNFASDATGPTHAQYARLLSEAVPGLFDGRYGLVTELGRSLLAMHGTVVARVEYAQHPGRRPAAGGPRQGAGRGGPALLRGRPAGAGAVSSRARTGRLRGRAGHRRVLLRPPLRLHLAPPPGRQRLRARRQGRRRLLPGARGADPRGDRRRGGRGQSGRADPPPGGPAARTAAVRSGGGRGGPRPPP